MIKQINIINIKSDGVVFQPCRIDGIFQYLKVFLRRFGNAQLQSAQNFIEPTYSLLRVFASHGVSDLVKY